MRIVTPLKFSAITTESLQCAPKKSSRMKFLVRLSRFLGLGKSVFLRRDVTTEYEDMIWREIQNYFLRLKKILFIANIVQKVEDIEIKRTVGQLIVEKKSDL